MNRLLLVVILAAACSKPLPPQPSYSKQTDNCIYDEVYFRCLSMAKSKFKAVNDGSELWSKAEIRCSNIAYSSSARNSTKVAARCAEYQAPP